MNTTRRKPRAVTAALLVLSLMAFLFTAPAAPVAAADTAPAVQVDQVVGLGWLEKAACIGCMAAFGVAGGGTLIGVMIVAGTFPEAAAMCAIGCYAAFT